MIPNIINNRTNSFYPKLKSCIKKSLSESKKLHDICLNSNHMQGLFRKGIKYILFHRGMMAYLKLKILF